MLSICTTVHTKEKRKSKYYPTRTKSLLYSKENLWQKKNINFYEVVVEAYNGGGVCALVGLFLLNNLTEQI